jgi:hypothetical protein
MDNLKLISFHSIPLHSTPFHSIPLHTCRGPLGDDGSGVRETRHQLAHGDDRLLADGDGLGVRMIGMADKQTNRQTGKQQTNKLINYQKINQTNQQTNKLTN